MKKGGFLETLLVSAPEANSRFVFLIAGISAAITASALGIAFIFVKDRSLFPAMVGTFLSGGALSAIGRWFTKIGDGKQGDNNAPPAPTTGQ